ncbi:hypothetical protein XHC_3157 [Xanthomonas hortorum pv. carotae str. M081]|nr:hypothetical protein XHC_3157 [Xanthomonas hortorum pv. carotae str. M081]
MHAHSPLRCALCRALPLTSWHRRVQGRGQRTVVATTARICAVGPRSLPSR